MLDPEKLYSQAVHSFNNRHKAVARTGKGGPAPRHLLPAAPPCGPRGQRLRARGRGKAYASVARAGGRERSSSPALTRRRAWPLTPCMALYDTMLSLKSPIGTHCLGFAFNLAGFILAAGEKVHVLVCLFVVFHFSHLLEQLEARLMIAEHTGQSVEKVSIFC
ncbi:ATP-dependent Clp protease proteolytic subunit-related protein 2, chloroplastic [Hordeum vulgare]|nr:ATP-dependent Clp protease proteolytic subunit-related protein 2, chloroplastic [Hordeum vulgare]